MPFTRTFKHWSRNEKGQALIEFALTFPLLLLLFLGAVEVSRYVLIIQKLENSVNTVTDVTAQAYPNSSPLSSAQMAQLTSAVQIMMNPYAFGGSGLIIITDVTQPNTGNPVINWQYCGGGTLAAASRIGTVSGKVAALPAGYVMIPGEEVLIGEIFYAFMPITNQQIIPGTLLYRTAIFMPRLGTLTGFLSTC